MADFNLNKALNTVGGVGALAGTLAGSYLGVPKAASNKSFLKKADMVGRWKYGASDPAGLMSQWRNTPTLQNITGKDLYNPSSGELFGSMFGAGMASYGAASNLTKGLEGQLGTTVLGKVPTGQVTGDLQYSGGTAMSDSDFSQLVEQGGQEGVINPLSVDTSGLKFTYNNACGGHLHGCGGHKFATGGVAFDNGAALSSALNLATAGLGIGLSYAGIMNQKRKAEQDALEVNNANLYAQQLQNHNFDLAVTDTKNNMFNQQALQMMAMGGDLQTHGADYPLLGDYNLIGAGGTHEQNPFGGVFQGMAADGKPNLVEEDEVVWNDYVFSNRLTIPKEFAKERKLKEGITYAQAAQKLAKEAEERPNDPISQNGLAEALSALMDNQEELKQKREAARIKRAISKMSPEEVMNMVASLQGAQQQAQPMEQPMMQQPMFADGGYLKDYSHIFDGTKEKSGKMTRKQKAAQEAARKEQAALIARNRKRLSSLVDKMSYDELTNYASNLPGYDASQYGTTGSVGALRDFIKSNGDYDAFRRHISDKQNLRYLDTEVPYDWSGSDYDDSDFRNLVTSPYDASKIPGKTEKHYAKDNTMVPTAEEREKDPDYIATTNYVMDQLANMQAGKAYDKDIIDTYVKWLDSHVAPNTVKLGVYDENGNLIGLADNAADTYKRLREDKIPGVYHLNFKTPTGSKKGTRVVYQVDGRTVEMSEDALKNNPYLKEKARRTVDDGDGKSTTYVDIESNPYDVQDVENDEEALQQENETPALQTITRYAPVVGSALGALAASAPAKDYSTAFVPRTATYAPIGDYLPYSPVDTQRYINAENQQAAAQLNAIMNASAGNRNMAMAQAALANRQRQQNIGQLLQAAEQVNWDRRRQAGDFNRGTNMFNAQAYNQAELANLQNNPLLLRQEQQNAMMRHAVDNERDAAISANINALLDSLGDIGRENFYFNQANSNEALSYGVDANPWFGGISHFKKPVVNKSGTTTTSSKSAEAPVEGAAFGGYLLAKPKKNRR